MSRTRGSNQALALAQGLGWFSIALGVAEVLAPHRVTRATGLHGHERLVSSYGVREIVTGIGLLTAKDPTPWVWGRVGGDALDLGTLAAGVAGPERERSGVAFLMTRHRRAGCRLRPGAAAAHSGGDRGFPPAERAAEAARGDARRGQ
jgi:hypothetical protein